MKSSVRGTGYTLELIPSTHNSQLTLNQPRMMMSATLPVTEPNCFVSLPRMHIISLDVAVRWRRPCIIPGPVVANVLRGALGITFRRLVCPAEWMNRECHPCALYAGCAYGRVFMPTPPLDAPQLRLQQDLPRPFVIEPPGLDPKAPVSPEGLTFRLMLFGTAIDRLPYFITTLERLGSDGMGRDRVPFDVQSIISRHPAGDECLFTAGSMTVYLPKQRLSAERLGLLAGESQGPRDKNQELNGSPSPCPRPSTVVLRFLTPTFLKTGSGVEASGRRIPATEVRDRPPFGVIVRRLRDRISSLCAFFGEPWHYPNFAALGRQADAVELIDSQTVWLTRKRLSTRTGMSHELSGFIGSATYRFRDAETQATFLPLLKIGEYVHVGKHAPWGNGKILVQTLGDAS